MQKKYLKDTSAAAWQIQLHFSALISGSSSSSRLQHAAHGTRHTKRQRGRERDEADEAGGRRSRDGGMTTIMKQLMMMMKSSCCSGNDSADGLTKQLSAVVRILVVPQGVNEIVDPPCLAIFD